MLPAAREGEKVLPSALALAVEATAIAATAAAAPPPPLPLPLPPLLLGIAGARAEIAGESRSFGSEVGGTAVAIVIGSRAAGLPQLAPKPDGPAPSFDCRGARGGSASASASATASSSVRSTASAAHPAAPKPVSGG